MGRIQAVDRAQLKLLCKRSEKYQVEIHNDGETSERIMKLRQAQEAIEELARKYNYVVCWPGIDPLFADTITGREIFTIDAL